MYIEKIYDTQMTIEYTMSINYKNLYLEDGGGDMYKE